MGEIEKRVNTVIIGGGPAGLTAAIYARRSLLNTILLEKLTPGGQAATTDIIDNYPGFPDGITGPELMQLIEKQAVRFGVEIMFDEAQEIIPKDSLYIVKTQGGENLLTKTIIIATGAEPKPLEVPQEKQLRGRGISYCATCDAAFFKNKTVAVIGGGDSALQEAIYLTKFASKVYIIHRRDQLRASKMLQEKAFKDEKIEFVWDCVLQNALGEKKVEGIEIKNVKTGEFKTIKLDGIFVSIGYNPNTAFLNDFIELDEQGYIITNEDTETSRPGIYAAGDVRKKSLKQIITAASDGAIAAYKAEEYISKNK